MTKFPFFVKTIHNIKRPVVPPPLPASPYEKVIDYENLKEGYTIVAEAAGPGATKWGKLKSGAGWISLDYVTKL